MSSEVTWVLDQFASVATTVSNNYTLASGDPVQLERVNRDESRILDQPPGDIQGELQTGVFVGATHVDTVRDPIGTEYDADREVVVGVRVTGLTHREYGHIDPSGQNGIPFDDADSAGIVQRLKDALLAERTWPAAGPADVSYTHLELQNEANTSQQYADTFRADWDVVFSGHEEL
ncbi:hypothetical protein [Halobacterium sp. BOL4-2]|uniref:hypothetical protein n=1 Tax=Halobacterium sp. BOL4-2 TaxID=2810537 RepID=UPI0019647CD7|nr:hypothetical protein [Halobacterium sp. BOL4-2]QRY26361.1 hypothetical protein JRZ79_13295 [Halobacterium sp. BOL4-2]